MRIGYVKIARYEVWKYMWLSREFFGMFRNSRQVKPGRWGFYFLGFEFGSRDPGDKVGLFLKRIGLYPW
jgi:hypothetical protein